MPKKTVSAKKARRERRADHSRKDIVRAAGRCFVRAGFEATTMRAIADEAGFTASSLYTYFDGKDEIFRALVDEVEEGCIAVFDQPTPTGMSFPQKLELLLMRFLEFTEENRDSVVFIAMAGYQNHKADLKFIQTLASWIDANTTKKERGSHTPDDAAYFMWGVMHGFFAQALSQGNFGSRIPLILKLILGGLNG